MTWKNGRRLATFTKGDVSASFDYDADGLRTTKTVGTSRVDYYRAGGLLLGEVHTDGDESYTINYMYDESGRMLGFRLDGAEYYYVRDYAGDVTGLINSRGELIGSYLYDPWGVLLETYLNTFEEETADWTDADRAEYMRVLNLNPIRYKSYYYDTETGFYYLQSRYYDPITTRFINADGLVSTGQDISGYNMFVYCGNNPINRSDASGMLWKEIGGFFKKAGKAIKNFAKSTFGAGSSTSKTIFKAEVDKVPNYLPVTVKSGVKNTKTVSKSGDSTKPISVYAKRDLEQPVKSSSAGIKINIAKFTLNVSLGLDDIGISGSVLDGNTSSSFGLKANISELKVGFESSSSISWDNNTETQYTNASINGWYIMAALAFVETGEFMQSPSYAYGNLR